MCKTDWQAQHELDARTFLCPMPLLKMRQALRNINRGERLLVKTTDPGAERDIPAYLGQSSHQLVRQAHKNGELWFLVECGEAT